MIPPRGWRDEASAGLAVKHLLRLEPEGPALVAMDPLPDVGDHLQGRGLEVARWHRRARGGRPAAPWPPEGPWATSVLRLPRAKEELEMALHALASVLRPGGRLFVHGANDEGIRSGTRRLEAVAERAWKVASGGKCRLLGARRADDLPELRGSLAAWRRTFDLPLDEIDRPWVSYPGVFAHGRLDEGTGLLLEALPELPPGAEVLDFGCGSGVIGAVAGARTPGASVECLDVDAVALEAARENVPGARILPGEGLGAVGDRRYDAILSNPPYHAGKAESTRVLSALVREAPAHLEPGGSLVIVVQRRLAAARLLEAAFRTVETLADRGPFRVWRAAGPR